MKTVSLHEARAHLSRLIEAAVNGEPFIITKAGKPLVRVEALDASTAVVPDRLGFLSSEFEVPDDFDTIGSAELLKQFRSGR